MTSLYRQPPPLSASLEQPQCDRPQCVSTRFSARDIAKEGPSSGVLVTVLMPCLNEACTLAACIQQAHAGCRAALTSREATANAPPRLRVGRDERAGKVLLHEHPTYEILIADNGSTDGSAEIATANDARVVHVEQKGYGAALMGGVKAARGTYVVMGDCDSSYDFGEIPRFVEKLEEGYSLVMGNRFAGGIQPGAMPWHHRYIGNPLLSGLGRVLYSTVCRDWHCGLRGFSREAVISLNLRCSGMEFASEMVLRFAQEKASTAEIPVALHPDGRRRSPHLRSFRDGVRHLRLLLIKALMTVFLIFTLGCGAEYSGETISVSPASANLGAVPAGTEISHVFKIQNISNEPIKITSISPSCSCIELKTEKGDPDGPLHPGDSVEVSANMLVTGESADEKGSISVECQTPRGEVVRGGTWFSLSVKEDYAINPKQIDFGVVEPGTKSEQRLTISSESGAIKIIGMEPSAGYIKVSESDGNSATVILKSDANRLANQVEECIYVRTSSKLRPVVAVPVTWEVRWDWKITPPVLAFTDGARRRKAKIHTSSPSTILVMQIPEDFKLVTSAEPLTKPDVAHEFTVECKASAKNASNKTFHILTEILIDGQSHPARIPLVVF